MASISTNREAKNEMHGLAQGIVAVVTGGASGNGRAIACKLAAEGANAVVIADLRREPREGGAPTDEVVAGLGATAVFVETDVSSPDSVATAVEAAEDFGGVDCMVNNAGILRAESFLEMTEADYDALMDINVKGVFFGAQSAASAMMRHGRGGSIINVSSVAGIVAGSLLPAYSATKGAIRLLTYSLSGYLGPMGIRVNALHPGIIDTAMTTIDAHIADDASARHIPLGRNGVPGDVADSAVFLASTLSRYISGVSLVIDGGLAASDAARILAPLGRETGAVPHRSD